MKAEGPCHVGKCSYNVSVTVTLDTSIELTNSNHKNTEHCVGLCADLLLVWNCFGIQGHCDLWNVDLPINRSHILPKINTNALIKCMNHVFMHGGVE